MTFLTLIGVKLLCIRFGKTNGFIRVYNRSRYLVLFGPGKYDVIKNRHLIIQKVVLHMLILITMQKSNLMQVIL